MREKAIVRPYRRELRRILLVPIAALLVFACLLMAAILELTRTAQLIDHTDQVIAAANHLEKLMISQETGVRGFLLSRDPVTLEPWRSSVVQIPATFDHLARLVADHPSQASQLQVIRGSHAAWQNYSANRIAHPDLATTTANVLTGKGQMDGIRGGIDRFLQTEEFRKVNGTSVANDFSSFSLPREACPPS